MFASHKFASHNQLSMYGISDVVNLCNCSPSALQYKGLSNEFCETQVIIKLIKDL